MLGPYNKQSCLLRVMPINMSCLTKNTVKQAIRRHPSTDCKYNCGALSPAAAFLETRYVIIPGPCPSFSFLFGETALQAYRDFSWSSAAGQPRQSHAGGQNPRKAWPGWGRAEMGWEKHEGWGGLGCVKRCGRHGDGEKGFAPLSAHLQLFMLHWPQ